MTNHNIYLTAARLIKNQFFLILITASLITTLRVYAQSSDVGFGSMTGRIIDAGTGRNIAGATLAIKVVEASDPKLIEENFSAITDYDGRFLITGIPAAIYEVRIFRGGYRLVELPRIEVLAGDQPAVVNYPMETYAAVEATTPTATSTDIFELSAFEVTADEMSRKEAAFIDLRRSVGGTVDFMTSEDFSKFAVTDLAGAVQKMPGVNVVEGKFAVVRGMNDRFNSTLVNGLPVPSPDPLRQGVQLDLFPTTIIDNVVANKSFLPQMPGNTSGAGFELTTKKFPQSFEAFIKFGWRINSNAEKVFLEDPQHSLDDALAMGKSNRGSYAINLPDGKGSSVEADFMAKETKPPLSLTFGAGFGESKRLWGRKLGYVVSMSYDSLASTETNGNFRNYFGLSSRGTPPGFPNYREPLFTQGSLFAGELVSSGVLQYTRSIYSVLMGALAQISYDLDTKGLNRISLVFLGSQTADDSVRRFAEGYLPEGGVPDAGVYSQNKSVIGVPNGNQTGYYYAEQIDYEERVLQSWQLIGDHLFTGLDDLSANWGVSYSKTTSDLPRQIQTNFLRYSQDVESSVNPGFGVDGGNDGVGAFLQEINRSIDHIGYSGRLDLSYPFRFFSRAGAKLSSGVFYDSQERTVDGFSQVLDATGAAIAVRTDTPYELSRSLVDLEATSRPLSRFPTNAVVTQDIEAGYLSLKIPLPLNLSMEGGVRLESLAMTTEGRSTLGGDSIGPGGASLEDILKGFRITQDGTILTNADILGFEDPNDPRGDIDEDLVLPGITIVYDPSDSIKIIAGFSETYARPSFRELSPYFDREPQTGDIVLGNPSLVLVDIQNIDLRMEYLLGEGDIASISFFRKRIENPIEQALLRSEPSIEFRSFFNNPTTATVEGVELELRYSLDSLTELLSGFSFGINATYIEAEVGVPAYFPESYFAFRVNQNTGDILRVNGPFVGDVGPPFGIEEDRLQKTRRLFDQPEWIVNVDLTYTNEDWGLSATLSLYAQSDVLSGIGVGSPSNSQNVLDQYTGSYELLNLSLSQKLFFLGDGASLKFAVSNITDSRRSVFYDPDIAYAAKYERLSYTLGQTYRISLQYDF